MKHRLWLLRCAWQGWRARRRGDFDTGVNDPYGRFVLSRAAVERLADDLASGRVKRRKVRMLKPKCCPTECDPACRVTCHESHEPRWKRGHEPDACPGAVSGPR